MIKIYYHVYAVDNVEVILDEQLNLLQNIKIPFDLNIGLSISKNDFDYNHLLDIINPTVINYADNEFLTLNLIEKDEIKDEDFIFYLHTKGASKINTNLYEVESNWRKLMNRNLITNYEKVLDKLNDYNTYGFQLEELDNGINIYSGNFWWGIGEYIKTIDTTGVDKSNRFNAELNFIQNGKNWNPYFITRKIPKKKMTLI